MAHLRLRIFLNPQRLQQIVTKAIGGRNLVFHGILWWLSLELECIPCIGITVETWVILEAVLAICLRGEWNVRQTRAEKTRLL